MSGSTPQLSPWQARQAAMLYWYSSLEYLQKLHSVLEQVVNGLVDPELVASSRHATRRILQHAQWGIQNAYEVVQPSPLSDFDCLKSSVAEDIKKRKKGVYARTATDDEMRKLQEFWVCAYPPEKEQQYQQAIALINHFSYPIDSLLYGFPSPRWCDFSFAHHIPSFMVESPVIPKFRVRTDITGTTGQQPPCTGVYVAADDTHASLQFSVVNRTHFGLTDASTFSQLGLEALHAIGRDELWFDEKRMLDFATDHKMWPELRKQIEISGELYPDLAGPAISHHAFEERPATWHFVEIIPGEFEDIGMRHVDLSLPPPPEVRKAGERCRQTGYYSSVKHVGSNRFFSDDDVFPALDGTGSETTWHWSDNYMRPMNC
ncbi:hypothetical protein ABT364_08395 [Massilia sp. SR12]